jgi:hypothetical protein
VQDFVNAHQGQARVTFANHTPEALSILQQNAPESLKAQVTKPGVEFVLPKSSLEQGTLLYEPGIKRKESPITTGQPIASKVLTTPQTPEEARMMEPVTASKLLPPVEKANVTFPSDVEKGLWTVGKGLKAKKGKAAAEAGLKLLSLRLGVPTETLRTAALAYHARAKALMKEQPRGKGYTAPEQTELPPEDQAPVGEIDDWKASDQSVPGLVTIKKDMHVDAHVLRAQALLQKWVKIFAPKMRVVIRGYAPAGFLGTAQMDSGVLGITIPAETYGTFKLALNLAHEFGHALVWHHLYGPAGVAKLAELRAEHQALLARVPTMTAFEFVSEWVGARPNANAVRFLKAYGVAPDAPAMELVERRDQDHDNAHLAAYGKKARAEQQARMGSYTLSFDEYAAEQVSRYMHRNLRGMTEETKSWVRDLLETMKSFYDHVASKLGNQPAFGAWMDELRAGAPQWAGTPSRSTLKIIPKEFQELDEAQTMKYTTKVLARLPNKPIVKKTTVYSEMGRADVRGQERELLAKVLATFPGDSVSSAEFNRAVLHELVPLTMKYSPQWASYGLNNILSLSGSGLNSTALRTTDGDNIRAHTHIWQVPFEVNPAGNHFNNDHYFGHTRGFVETLTIGGRHIIVPVANIVEVQSDLAQKQNELTPEERARLEKELVGLQSYYAELLRRKTEAMHLPGKQAPVTQSLFDFYSQTTDSRERDISPGEHTILNFLHWVDYTIEDVRLLMTETTTKLATKAADTSGLPKNWWELLLREEIRLHADSGMERIRVASADTVAKVEGWTEIEPYEMAEYILEEEDEHGNKFWTISQVDPKLDGIEYGSYETAWAALNNFSRDDLRNRIPEEFRFIYDRYADEIPKFLKREFGAKLVNDRVSLPQPSRDVPGPTVDTSGNTWWEFEVKPDQKDLPIMYFELDDGDNDIADAVAPLVESSDNPEAPAVIHAWPAFMLRVMQLNQMAKVMPGIPGLQLFRRLMQDMTNLKNQLMAGPNERIKQWYRIGQKQKKAMELFMRDEINGGKHWSTLRQIVTDHAGKAMVRWEHSMNDALWQEFEKRGLDEKTAELYLGIKNDFLLDLDIMERMVLKSIDKYFASNPLAGNIRKLDAQKEFQKLRDTPYFPDRRFGKWAVQIRSGRDALVDGREIKKGELIHWAKFETKWARDKAFKKLHAEWGKEHSVVPTYVEDSVYVLRGLPRDLVQTVAETLSLSPDDVEKLKQIQYDYTKEGAFFKLLGAGKKGIGGANTDLRRVYADYHWRTANLIAKMTYSQELKSALGQIETQAEAAGKAGDTSNFLDQVHERLNSTLTYVMRPSHEFEQLRAMVSLWYLWGVPKTALMNFMSVPVLGYAHLGSKYGDVAAVAQLTRAMKDISTSKWNTEALTPDEYALLARAKEDGVTDQSFMAEMASASSPSMMENTLPQWEWFQDSGASDALKKTTWYTVEMGMKPFRLVEEFNRRTMLLAAYRLEIAKGSATVTSGDPTAYLLARDAVDYTQNEYNPWNRPTYLQGKQSLFLIFYSFVQHAGFFVFGGDKGWWRAWLVLLGLAGVQGLPGVDNLLTVLSAVWQKISGERMDLREEGRKLAQAIGANPDLIMHGSMHSMFGLGWDASYSVGFGQIIPGLESAFSDGDFDSNLVRFLSDAGGPFSSLTINALKAYSDDNAQAMLRLERMLPTTLRNVSRAARMGTDGIMTDNLGRPLVTRSPTTGEILGQALGFAPTAKSQKQEQLAMARDMSQFYILRREHFMALYHQAKSSGDQARIDKVRAMVEEYNDRVPYALLKITGASLAASSRLRDKAEREQAKGSTMERRYKHLYENANELFDDASQGE